MCSSDLIPLNEQLTRQLEAQGDPRMQGRGALFDRYVHAAPANVDFYARFMRGEKVQANWVNTSDFEPVPADKSVPVSPTPPDATLRRKAR